MLPFGKGVLNVRKVPSPGIPLHCDGGEHTTGSDAAAWAFERQD